MPRAPKYTRQQNFSNDEARGLESPQPSKLDAELDAVQTSLNLVRNRLEGIVSVGGQLKPNQVVNASLTQINTAQEFTATGGTPETFTFATAIDTTSNVVQAYKNGLILKTSEYTLNNANIQINTTAGDSVVVFFYDAQDSTLTLLGNAIVGTEGADLVGYGDESGYGAQLPITNAPSTVKEGLDLALQNIVNIGDTFFPVSQWVKTDGSTPLLANWNVGGTYRITGHPASTASGELVEHSQLEAINQTITNLNYTFVAIDGSSSMTGDLDLNMNKVVNVDNTTAWASVAATTVPSKGQVDGELNLRLKLDGTTPMTGTLNTDGNNITLGTGEATTSTAPSVGDALTNKTYVDGEVTTLQTQIDALEAEVGSNNVDPGGCGLGDSTTLDITNGGEYHTTGNTTIASPVTPTNNTFVRVKSGSLTVSGTIGGGNLVLDVQGDLTIGAAVTLTGDLTLKCTGNLQINAPIVAATVTYDVGGTTNITNTVTVPDQRGVFAGNFTLSSTLRAVVENAVTATGVGSATGGDGTGPYKGTGGQGYGGTGSSGEGHGGGGGGATGGGNGGNGSTDGGEEAPGGTGGNAVGAAPINRSYLMEASTGGAGGAGSGDPGDTATSGRGGGIILLYIDGDATMTSGTVSAAGDSGTLPNGEGSGAGGGGGGVIKIACTGSVNGGTVSSNGGNGLAGDGADGGGGGGGGTAAVLATAQVIAPTVTAAGGTPAQEGIAGSVGSATLDVTFSTEQIACLRPLVTV